MTMYTALNVHACKKVFEKYAGKEISSDFATDSVALGLKKEIENYGGRLNIIPPGGGLSEVRDPLQVNVLLEAGTGGKFKIPPTFTTSG